MRERRLMYSQHKRVGPDGGPIIIKVECPEKLVKRPIGVIKISRIKSYFLALQTVSQ